MQIIKLLIVVHLLVFLHRCGNSGNFIFNTNTMEKKITLKPGETYSFELDNLGGAGYSWITDENNEKVTLVKITSGVTEKEVNKMPVGGSITIKVTVMALAEGRSHIRLSQKRIWEEGVAPAKTVAIDVLVKK